MEQSPHQGNRRASGEADPGGAGDEQRDQGGNMNALGWVLVVVGIVFGLVGGFVNVLLAQNYSEFWLVSLPVALVGLGLGGYLVSHSKVQRG
jgi:hypothetical protein